MDLHPDFFKGQSRIVERKARDKSAFRKFRDVFHYHYRTDRAICCKTCVFSVRDNVKKTWRCRLQGWHRTGAFWVCLKFNNGGVK